MDVFDLQARISIDTAPYIEALRRAADETDRLRARMSAPITTTLSATSTTPGTTPGGSSAGITSTGLTAVTADAEAAGKAVDELNQKLSQGFTAATKVAAAAWATASAAIAAGTKKAVEGFAQYEQLVGGVDTIFKESSKKVQEYADNAFQTAGMSANRYMETVTSFSMSLLQGLAGDTEKAAEMADMAITDMSDNVNKMGTAMESIERAYQGFAKQNYTMLDNLKLGYGGTKAEMERLLADAEKLSGMKFEITNYSDIIQAIHIIQENLDITGTTAKEAADTIEGSFNSTKAALDNLLVGFARSDADIDKLMKDVEDNFTNLANNVIPVAEKAFVNLTKAAIETGTRIAKELPSLVRKASEDVHKMIVTDFSDISDKVFLAEGAVKTFAATLIAVKATSAILPIVDAFNKVNAALKTGVTLSEAFAAANLANPILLIAAAATAATVAFKSWLDVQTDLIEEAVDGYDYMDTETQKVVSSIRELSKTVSNNQAEWDNANKSIEENSARYADLTSRLYKLDSQEKLSIQDKAAMKAIVDELNNSIDGMNIKLNEQTGHLETQKETIDELIRSYQDQAKATAAQERLVKLYDEQWKAEKNLADATKKRTEAHEKLKKAQDKVAESEAKLAKFEESHNKLQIWGKETEEQYRALKQSVEDANQALWEQEQSIGDIDEQWRQADVTFKETGESITETTNILAGMGEKADASLSQAIESVDIFGATMKAISEVAQQVDESTEGFFVTIRDNSHVLSVETAEEVGRIIDAYDELYNAQYDAIAKSVDLYKGFEADTSVTYQDLYNNLQESSFYINDWSTAIDQLQAKVDKGLMSQEFLDSLKDMGLDSWNIVYNMNHATGDQLKEYSDLWVKANKQIEESTDKLTARQKEQTEERLGQLTGFADANIDEYKAAFEKLGVSVGDGLEKGIQESVKEAEAAMKETGENLIRIGFETLDAASPSKEFEKLGQYIDDGLVLGIEERSGAVYEAVRTLAKDIITATEKELEIKSPSKAMYRLGKYTSEGFAKGIEQNAEEVAKATKAMTNAVNDTAINTEYRTKIPKAVKTTSSSSTTYETQAVTVEIDAEKIAEAVKRGIQDIVSGDVNINLTINEETIASAIFPKIDALQGKKAQAAMKGYTS